MKTNSLLVVATLLGLTLSALAQTEVIDLPASPFEGNNLKIRAGQVEGVSTATAIGHCNAVGTESRVLYHACDVADLTLATLIATPAVVGVASTDVDDDADGAATGATAVQVTGLNASLVETTETVVLNGQTEVATTTVFYVVTKLQVVTAGSSGFNEGTLWVGGVGSFTAGVPSVKYCAVESESNQSASAVKAVPAGKQLHVTGISLASGDTNKLIRFHFNQYDATRDLWYRTYDVHGKQTFLTQKLEAYPVLRAGDVLTLQCSVDTGSAAITATVVGVFVDEI